MNLDTIIVGMRRESIVMSFPREIDIETAKIEKGTENIVNNDLPRETARNIIINSLALYKVTDRVETFEVHRLAMTLMDETETLTAKQISFLSNKVLPQATILSSEKNGEEKGIYNAWAIGQVFEALGITE